MWYCNFVFILKLNISERKQFLGINIPLLPAFLNTSTKHMPERVAPLYYSITPDWDSESASSLYLLFVADEEAALIAIVVARWCQGWAFLLLNRLLIWLLIEVYLLQPSLQLLDCIHCWYGSITRFHFELGELRVLYGIGPRLACESRSVCTAIVLCLASQLVFNDVIPFITILWDLSDWMPTLIMMSEEMPELISGKLLKLLLNH